MMSLEFLLSMIEVETFIFKVFRLLQCTVGAGRRRGPCPVVASTGPVIRGVADGAALQDAECTTLSDNFTGFERLPVDFPR